MKRPEFMDLVYRLSPYEYLRSLRFTSYPWQREVLESRHKRIFINGARQAGKSTIISVKPCHRARFYPGSLSLVIAATERQAVEDMEKIRSFIAMDAGYPALKRSSDSLIELPNRSRIAVAPSTETSARGYSSPDIIILDEASRIEDPVYRSGIIPMLTDNAKCELILISTPHGRKGFFYTASRSARWERYEVRCPWEVKDLEYKLVPAGPEEGFRIRKEAEGVKGFYSPRHQDLDEAQMNLEEMGPLMYRQEYCCEFVEPEDQVFSYDEIDALFRAGAEPLDMESVPEAEGLAGLL
jgi:hypothetical protein